MYDLKKRVGAQTLKTIWLRHGEVGAYALIYILGEKLYEVMQKLTGTGNPVKFDSKFLKKLVKQYGFSIIAKAGTCRNRTTSDQDPFRLRSVEQRGCILKCTKGKFDSQDLATRKVFTHLQTNPTHECHMLMIGISSFDEDDIETVAELENYVRDHVKTTFGLIVENDPENFKGRECTRWNNTTVNLAI